MKRTDLRKDSNEIAVNRESKDTPIIIAPSHMVLDHDAFQRKLRDEINREYAEAKLEYESRFELAYSSRKFYRFIGDTLYDYPGDIYTCDEQGCFRKHQFPDVSEALGDDARWLRGFMKQHRPRRDRYKLMLLAVFIGIRKPFSYEWLITIY
ncbi:hypothetical protein [Agarilytica rhodophyticola]|uniref:hypothetical protein n=1 Tax=Agarilytica rhodophyticola TaxID=1737490 RepID=UPI000B343F8F|nr:hypothetical protein [Agarilytica rhodophyticola]